MLKKFKIAIGRLEYSQVSNLKSSRCGVPTVWCETHSGNYWNDSRGHLISGDSLLAGFFNGLCWFAATKSSASTKSADGASFGSEERTHKERTNLRSAVRLRSCCWLCCDSFGATYRGEYWQTAVFLGRVVVATRSKLNPLLSFLLQKKKHRLWTSLSQKQW